MAESQVRTDGGHDTSGRFLEATRRTWQTASFKAGQYRRIVQKKIDLNAVQKRLDATHTDLGRLVDDLRETGDDAILEKHSVRELLARIDTLKETATTLRAEIATIRAETRDENETPPAH